MNCFLAFFVVLALADARPQYNGLVEGGAGAEGHIQGGQVFIFHSKFFFSIFHFFQFSIFFNFPFFSIFHFFQFSIFFNFAQLGSFISLL